ncbi:MAG: TauD/TfdA family dioxygenase [Hyphomicrobiaceae bacterium]|nr:TauD/TfdA family dioxygenase [Hyphomicrobiaceae bacterium]
MGFAQQDLSSRLDQAFKGRFDLSDATDYLRWRASKLSSYPTRSSELIVEIGDLARPTEVECAQIIMRCRTANMAIYSSRPGTTDEHKLRQDLAAFAGALGLGQMEGHRSAATDGFVSLEVAKDSNRRGYIPYSNRPLTWHTDGYYNAPENRIRAFLLHCVRDADEGGENALLDPEITYIRLRDENPAFIEALMHPDAMTIPENRETSGKLRPASRGPVFSIDPTSNTLHMRYSARSRNIIWRDDRDTSLACAFLADLVAGNEPLVLKHKLIPGQGLICNNVLHCRSGFDDGSLPGPTGKRLLLRARYLDRVAGTTL